MSESNGGRPTVMTDDVIRKLEYAFSIGCSDLNACSYAGIGKTALYNYQQEHPEFVERKNQLKEQQVLKARVAVDQALDRGDVNTARWLLERKCKEEFSARTEIDPVAPLVKYITAEEQSATDAHIDDIIGND